MSDVQTKAQRAEQQAREAREQAVGEQRRRWEEQRAALPARDAELLDRHPDEDRRLQQEEREAREAFAAKLVEEPWVKEWVRARAARFARQQLSRDAAMAAQRSDGRRVAEVPYRDPRLVDDLLDVLERTASETARDLQPDVERPPAPGPDPALVAKLRHRDGCPTERVEAVAHGVRCMDCGASKVDPPPPEPLPAPDSAEYRRLWKLHPFEIARQLDPEDRDDPRLNPTHPHADDEPPEWRGGRPIP